MHVLCIHMNSQKRKRRDGKYHQDLDLAGSTTHGRQQPSWEVAIQDHHRWDPPFISTHCAAFSSFPLAPASCPSQLSLDTSINAPCTAPRAVSTRETPGNSTPWTWLVWIHQLHTHPRRRGIYEVLSQQLQPTGHEN